MATVLWIPWPETGHVLATMKIATALHIRGHRVVYLGVPAIEESVTRRGLQFIRILESSFTTGFLGWDGSGEKGSGRSAILRWKTRRKKVSELVEVLFGDAGVRLLQEIKPDFVITDTLLPSMALQAYRLGIPAAIVCTTMPHNRQPGHPPLTTGIMPQNTLLSRGVISLAWSWHRAGRSVSRRLGSFLGETVNSDPYLRRLALGVGYPVERMNYSTTFEPSLGLPELVTAPREFDFPHAAREEQYFVESIEHEDSAGEQFPWERIPSGKPLLHISLGSQSHQLGEVARRFFRVAVRAAGHCPEYHAVVAVGRSATVEELQSVPENVTVVPWAPDYDVLQRASLMITHAGLGSVKKCLYHGVPMIAFPCMRDQFGNAARIVYHGLGIRGEIGLITTQRLVSMIRQIEGDPAYRARAQEFQRHFQRSESSGFGSALIEKWIREGAHRTPHDRREMNHGAK